MRRVIILGNSKNGILHQLVAHFLTSETLLYLVDGKYDRSHPNLNLISSHTYVPRIKRLAIHFLASFVEVLDLLSVGIVLLLRLRFKSFRQYLTLPGLKRPISNMFILSKVVNELSADYVLCLNAYFYGLCAICIRTPNVVVAPWGSDVNVYGTSSPIRFVLMRKCLHHARYIAPAGRSVMGFIEREYNVTKEKIVFLRPMVDATMFFRPSRSEKEEIRAKLKIPITATVIFSCRRFGEGWGPDIIRKLFMEMSKSSECSNFVFMVLSGYPENHSLNEFVDSVSREDKDRFLFIDRAISLYEFGEYAKASDFFISAMTNRDMQSSSIMQSTACGSYPILLEQEEYLLMKQEGFRALLFDRRSDSLIADIVKLAKDRDALEREVQNNVDYIRRVAGEMSYVSRLNSLSFD